VVIRGHEQIIKKVGFKLRRKNKEFNTCITVRAEDNNNDPERMIRRFRKLVKNEGIMQEIYDRRYYTSPSEVRREEKRQRQTTNATGTSGTHTITLPNGTNTGETVKIIFLDTPANGTSIEFSTTNFLGVSSLGLPGSTFVGGGAQGGCLDLIWTGSKWVIVSVNHKVSAS